MARRGRPTRGRGGKSGWGAKHRDDPGSTQTFTTQEIVPLDFAEPERPSRAMRGRGAAPKGGAFLSAVVPLVLAMVAALIMIGGGLFVAGGSKPAMEKVFDETGMAAALTLSVIEPDWWKSDHGKAPPGFSTQFLKLKERELKKVKREIDTMGRSSQDLIVAEQEFKNFIEKYEIKDEGTLTAAQNSRIMDANKVRLQRLLKIPGPNFQPAGNSNILYAAIFDDKNMLVLDSGSNPKYNKLTWRNVAGVKVTSVIMRGDVPGRLYEVPIKDRFDSNAGTAKILVAGKAVTEGGGATGKALLVALIGVIAVGLTAFLLCKGASKGINAVTRGLDQVARGDLDVRFPSGGGGEITALSRTADRAVKTMVAMQAQAAAAAAAPVPAAEGAGVDTAALLPKEPPRVEGYEVEAVHKPCAEGANDFYDYISIDDDHLGIVIADMPHPGPQGGFIASTFRALIRAYGIGETSPAVVLGRVNRVMAGELKRGDHITAMYTVLDLTNGILTVASAGHLPLIFWKLTKRASAILNPEGIAIGLDKGPVFEKTVVDKRIKLDKGDRFVVHTDGPVAAKNINGEEYGEERFYYLVNREAPKNSAAFVNFTANEVDLFHEGAAQIDDITIVTVRKLGD